MRILFALLILFLTSCEIEREIKFNSNNSGTQTYTFKYSESLMSLSNGLDKKTEVMSDTTFSFVKQIDDKREYISGLEDEEQEAIELLKNYTFFFKTDTVSKQSEIKIIYDFRSIEDLKLSGDIMKKINFEKLFIEESEDANSPIFTYLLMLGGVSSSNTDDKSPFFSSNYKLKRKSFSSHFIGDNKNGQKEIKNSNMMNLYKMKLKYIFPKKVKKVSNSNARISTNFKEVEISTTMSEILKNPNFFDLDISF